MNLAELEAEILLLGIWKNVEDLEENLSLPELEAILVASRDKEHRQNRFMAALKGIDIDEGKTDDAKERFDKIQSKVAAQLSGESQEKLEIGSLGMEFEVEE